MIAGMDTQGMDRSQVERLVRQVLAEQWAQQEDRQYRPQRENGGPNPLVVNVSARHCHVTDADLERLFGPGAELTVHRELYQDGEFASEQTVNIIGPRNRMIPNVRILGPTRRATQVELAYSDGVYMGMDLPLRISGDIEGTPGCVMIGPHGAINLDQGVIRAKRHVHMSPADCAHFGVDDGEHMKLHVEGPCGVTFDNLQVRRGQNIKLEVHIDTDEGNACDLASAERMELLKQ